LEADPDVLSVNIDHPMKGLDDVTDVATERVPPPGPPGYNGTGVGVAVIDSGINDSHPDLLEFGTRLNSRVVYRQDFTGTGEHQPRSGPSMTFTVTELTSPESLAATATSRAGTMPE
jgi:subtilisin family serine protease